MTMWAALKPTDKNLRWWQLGVLFVFLGMWQLASRDQQYAFFLGEPIKVLGRIWSWFMPFGFGESALFPDGLPGRADIYLHLGVTLLETLLAFAIGTALGLVFGLWLALAPTASAILDPYIKAANSMPRVILAPIFAMWFGLGIWSKVALAVTLVFFIVFFNVYQGVKEVSPVVLANARMLGANQKQLLRTVYLPSATSWVFSSLHTSVGLAFVGAVVGEYLGSARGVGYLILQAEGTFDVNTVFAGIAVLTAFALVLDGLVGRIERRLMKWQPRLGETAKL
jgi:NitT/TauT family transport system permease protein